MFCPLLSLVCSWWTKTKINLYLGWFDKALCDKWCQPCLMLLAWHDRRFSLSFCLSLRERWAVRISHVINYSTWQGFTQGSYAYLYWALDKLGNCLVWMIRGRSGFEERRVLCIFANSRQKGTSWIGIESWTLTAMPIKWSDLSSIEVSAGRQDLPPAQSLSKYSGLF